MDILMIYWNDQWSHAVAHLGHGEDGHTACEWAAYRRSLKRHNPLEDMFRRAGPLGSK